MKVSIAGYNIDSSQIALLDPQKATPESISAAYARISRSEKDIASLRQEALQEIIRSRKSNQNIIFEMGHSSIAEHAVFNIDLVGISRLLTETVQRSRLASFTEKSQRYVTFHSSFVIPEELAQYPDLRTEYIQICESLFAEYALSIDALAKHLAELNPGLSKRDLQTKAKEDARYILPLATKTQMGITINARSLELLLRRLSTSPCLEAKELWTELEDQISAIAPSLIRYTKGDAAAFQMPEDSVPNTSPSWADELPHAQLLDASANGDEEILATLWFEQFGGEPTALQEKLARLDDTAKKRLWNQLFADLQPWQKMPRAFEVMQLKYLLQLSECSWSQLKRHRSATLIRGAYSFDCPLVIPKPIASCNREHIWQDLLEQVRRFRARLDQPLQAYLRLNAESVQVFATLNLRELYHFSRLRSDEHAQWEIRLLSDQMVALAKPHAPLAAALLGGKSDFEKLNPDI